MNLISRRLGSRTLYWNGTGWCPEKKRARIYNDHDARQAHKAMTLDSIMADIRPLKRSSR